MDALTVLVKSGTVCNLACEYCFDLPITAPSRLAVSTARLLFEQLAELPVRNIVIAWHGGEPLTAGIGFFEEMLLLQKQLLSNHHVSNCIHTNGILLDPGWAEFLAHNLFHVGISLDGPREFHDRYRRTREGRGSFDLCVSGFQSLLQYENISSTVSVTVLEDSWTVAKQTYLLAKDLGADGLWFEPHLVHCRSRNPGLPSVSAEAFLRFVLAIYDEWKLDEEAGREHPDVSLFQALNNEREIERNSGNLLCWLCPEQCLSNLMVDTSGSVYPCDAFHGYEAFVIGNIHEAPISAILNSDRRTAYIEQTSRLPEACHSCQSASICGGGCRYHRSLNALPFSTVSPYCSLVGGLRERILRRPRIITTDRNELPGTSVNAQIQQELVWPLGGNLEPKMVPSWNLPTFEINEWGPKEHRLLKAWQQRWERLWRQHVMQRNSGVPPALMGAGSGGLEVSLLIAGLRPSVRIVVNAGAIVVAVERASQLGLCGVPSPFIFRTIPKDPLYSYSDEVIVLDEGQRDPTANAFLYLSSKPDEAWRLWAVELLEREPELGMALGYPACCCESYGQGKTTDTHTPPIVEQSYLLNIEAQVLGYQIISHTPCSPLCAASLSMAARWAAYLRRLSPQTFQRLCEVLTAAVLRFSNGERLFFMNTIREGDTLLCLTPSRVLPFGSNARKVAASLRRMNRPLRLVMRKDHICHLEKDACLPGGPHRLIFNAAPFDSV